MKEKKKLTQQQEFEIMKLVLDKFLWLGAVTMLYGMYLLFSKGWAMWQDALAVIIAGAVVLLLFMWIIVKEYEIIK
ncbi:hypothetical protein COV19_06700 [Candidatus Woesearchaeota archaeon CG10_big_fil_rev_8_21_14_0_10_44_13]|nr:MAG: hypothetical protein COV19_06700 [Candidatus Woesearchaeota archaeon CG10_big_fil_rev_8_21_14_0_10_44_13]